MRAVLGFSTALGARFSRARLERAFRGFLCKSRVRFLNLSIPNPGGHGLHLAQHFVGFGGMVKGIDIWRLPNCQLRRSGDRAPPFKKIKTGSYR